MANHAYLSNTEIGLKGVAISDIRAVKANRIRCYGCHRVLNWEPAWEWGSGDKGDQCWHCGTTAVTIEPRRSIGRRSRFWPEIVTELEAAFEFMPAEDVRAALILNEV